MQKNVLGRGLGSLIQTRPVLNRQNVGGAAPGEVIRQVDLGDIVSSPLQPRQDFKPESLQELVESIREQGIIQPLIVRKVAGKYELIAGERRWRAAKTLVLKHVPVIVREATDQEVLELALIENLQRADLSVVEEARAYARLAAEFSLPQEEIAKKVGKSRASVANAMRLLDLDPQVLGWLNQERLSVGHAKVLLGLKAPEDQRAFAEMIIRQHTSVRGAEKLVGEHLGRLGNSRTGPGARSRAREMPPTLKHLQNRLQQHFATHVALRHGEKKGCIEIEYYGNDDLDRILAALGIKPEAI